MHTAQGVKVHTVYRRHSSYTAPHQTCGPTLRDVRSLLSPSLPRPRFCNTPAARYGRTRTCKMSLRAVLSSHGHVSYRPGRKEYKGCTTSTLQFCVEERRALSHSALRTTPRPPLSPDRFIVTCGFGVLLEFTLRGRAGVGEHLVRVRLNVAHGDAAAAARPPARQRSADGYFSACSRRQSQNEIEF